MEDNSTIDFEAFDEAYGAEDGYQTDGAEETAESEDTTAGDEITDDTAQEPSEATETGGGSADTSDSGTDTGDGSPEPGGDTFTLKVNKETRTVNREEVITLAQKGADYDRVKGALEKATTQIQTLQTESAAAVDAYAILTELAKDSKISVPEYLDELRIGNLVKTGIPRGEAKERLARERLEKENAALRGAKPEKSEAQKLRERADQEIAEFREAYPDVPITQELVDSLMDDVHGGMTLVRAYQKQENAKLAAEIRRLEQELAAERKNKANRGSSPGSMSDSGSRKSKDMFDKFFEALG